MKLTSIGRVSTTILLIAIISSCSNLKVISHYYVPKTYSTIDIEDFESIVAQYLINPPISLRIDSTAANTIIASEIYDGRKHMKWFFFEKTWKEKTVYTVKYKKEEGVVSFNLKIETFETPSERYIKWRTTQPSKNTKENLIINTINNYGTQ